MSPNGSPGRRSRRSGRSSRATSVTRDSRLHRGLPGAHGGHDLAGVAVACGYSDQAHLSHEWSTDPDAVAERARRAGARLLREPVDTDYGSHETTVADPDGNAWTFGTYPGE